MVDPNNVQPQSRAPAQAQHAMYHNAYQNWLHEYYGQQYYYGPRSYSQPPPMPPQMHPQMYEFGQFPQQNYGPPPPSFGYVQPYLTPYQPQQNNQNTVLAPIRPAVQKPTSNPLMSSHESSQSPAFTPPTSQSTPKPVSCSMILFVAHTRIKYSQWLRLPSGPPQINARPRCRSDNLHRRKQYHVLAASQTTDISAHSSTRRCSRHTFANYVASCNRNRQP